VRASTPLVVEWWRHPDRKQEHLDNLVKKGMTDISLKDSLVGSVRIREIEWTTRVGSSMHHRIETELGSDGLPGGWQGDRFLIVAHEVSQSRSRAKLQVVDCNQTLEFNPVRGDETEVVSTHQHRKLNARWFEALLPSNSTRTAFAKAEMDRQLEEVALRCEQSLSLRRT
jgi:hypothetical protein